MEIMLRATAIYFFMWLLTRGLGKRELSEMTAFELILMVTIGDLVQQGVTQEDMSVTGAMLAIGTIGIWIAVFSYVAFKIPGRARQIIEGVPVVVVKDGEPLTEILAMERVLVDEVDEAAREQGIADLATVRLAILEPDGKFSFIVSGREQDATGGDKHKA